MNHLPKHFLRNLLLTGMCGCGGEFQQKPLQSVLSESEQADGEPATPENMKLEINDFEPPEFGKPWRRQITLRGSEDPNHVLVEKQIKVPGGSEDWESIGVLNSEGSFVEHDPKSFARYRVGGVVVSDWQRPRFDLNLSAINGSCDQDLELSASRIQIAKGVDFNIGDCALTLKAGKIKILGKISRGANGRQDKRRGSLKIIAEDFEFDGEIDFSAQEVVRAEALEKAEFLKPQILKAIARTETKKTKEKKSFPIEIRVTVTKQRRELVEEWVEVPDIVKTMADPFLRKKTKKVKISKEKLVPYEVAETRTVYEEREVEVDSQVVVSNLEELRAKAPAELQRLVEQKKKFLSTLKNHALIGKTQITWISPKEPDSERIRFVSKRFEKLLEELRDPVRLVVLDPNGGSVLELQESDLSLDTTYLSDFRSQATGFQWIPVDPLTARAMTGL